MVITNSRRSREGGDLFIKLASSGGDSIRHLGHFVNEKVAVRFV